MAIYYRSLILTLMLLLSTQAMALQCYLTIMKSKCWNKHNVTLSVYDNKTEEYVFKDIKLDQDKLWLRKKFDCSAGQGLLTKAKFSPKIWENDSVDKEYRTTRIWFLPLKMEELSVAWNIPICFPNDFADTPMLPHGTDDCNCQRTKSEVTPLPKPPNFEALPKK